jgi:hypothetical protein
MSPAHAAVVVKTIDRLPDAALDDAEDVETALVANAGGLDPDQLSKLARRIADLLDPDGSLREVKYRDKTRSLHLHIRPDGSAHLDAELTAQTTEALRTVLDPLAKPLPEADGVPDRRPYSQRCHDALLEALTLAIRAADVPATAGVATTVILTTDAEDWATGQGFARTAHGSDIPVAEAHNWVTGETAWIGMLLDSTKAVVAQSENRRLFTPNQRLALATRDRGCSFPGCDRPPAYCQAHHIKDHCRGGPTTLENGTLLCGYHHRNFAQQGWTCHMQAGIPHWTPPRSLDPTRRPRRNPMHHTADRL